MRRRDSISIRPRIRVYRGETIVLGPGKADLLEAIDRTGSIRAAAEELGMSYMRAWSLVRTMNESFDAPVVSGERGGAGKGGASLTARGREVLDTYRKMEVRATKSIAPLAAKLKRRVR